MTYRLAEPVPEAIDASLEQYSPLLRQLLYNRDIKTAEAAERFLTPQYNEHLHDPFLMRDMEKAVARILSAGTAGERIAIYSDYDCDGIPGAVVLHDCFKKIGFENFINYIPHRHYEGFGLNQSAVEKLAADGVTLIITIDCGTTDQAAVAAAVALGVDVIITDHHEIPAEEPNAVALLNPKLADGYPFPDLCGAGVVYKLVQALLTRGDFSITPGWEKWLLDMVGVATIADMVPLIDENRVLAHYGLTVLKKSRRPGLQHLFRVTKASQQHASEDDVGFTIGPRVNAASRMDTPEDAFHLLATTDEGEAGERARHLEALNQERKTSVALMSKELNKRLKTLEELPPVLVFGNPEWRPSLVGLAANTLAEAHKRPAFVWGRDGNGTIKGSCRSDGQVSVVALMTALGDDLLESGGHHFSGGFAVAPDKVHGLQAALSAAYKSLGDQAIVDTTVVADAELTLDAVTNETLRTLTELAPYGTGNEKPIFLFRDVTPTEVSVFGKTKEHTKLIFETSGKAREAIQFFKTPDAYEVVPKAGTPLQLLAHIEQSFFMGRVQNRLRIVDILA